MVDNNSGKYSIPEGESYQAGSNNTVLANKLRISSVGEMEKVEATLLQKADEKMIDIYSVNHQFNTEDVCDLHRLWLSDVYTWAGKYRTVNMSKGGFQFAAAHLIPKLMQDFEKKILKKYTPTHVTNKKQLTEALAIVHVEYILIHPFREGNGRLGRMLATLMTLQAGFPILDFNDITTGSNRERYFSAVQQGMDCNYEPMAKVFEQVIKDSY
ncbi:MAG: Fic family protein [Gammaproteobacteria bacterium]